MSDCVGPSDAVIATFNRTEKRIAMTTVKNRKRMQSVKIAFKAALLLPVLLSAACSITSVPGGVYTDFDVRDKVWAVSGFSAPKGYQEIIDLHYDSLPDNDTLGLVCAELLFTDDSLTIVYPSGAYRSMGYSLDGKSHTAVFDGVLVYGSYDAEDVRSCRCLRPCHYIRRPCMVSALTGTSPVAA